MKITVECKVGQAITVSIDDETLVNHIGFVEEKPIEQETCKYKRHDGNPCLGTDPHYGKLWGLEEIKHCPECGKKIEVAE